MLKDEKGITFSIMSETEAAEYLSKRNNYMRTASYRKNYAKHETGAQVGKYIKQRCTRGTNKIKKKR